MTRNIRFVLGAAAIIAGAWLLLSNIQPFFTATKSNHAKEEVVQAKDSIQKTKTEENVLYPHRPKLGEKIGELYIPKISSTLPIIHGTNEEELEKGVGHFAGSVLPGEDDNSVLSGHRDTVFRKLGKVGIGDLLIVTTSAGEFTYKVRKVRIVDADDKTVIVPKPRATLTVTTCYPFHFIGDAPERYVLVADLVKK
ncbi:class D sortase [Bacillus methanolicus]|uniref:Sortase family protein n=1 Tax=Bacillus methanolicus (strain MGA3 / ATCC 53907) TaxID=796606 RepID=I3DUD7_BACMM|nr:class D sortase [Bacillus methanolicus]AIE61258.1 sortase family protein [Bacillus methanolicus MGA3]EIJ77858.1 sortase family protein [Bacillus methanolicus MGA3]UQD53243.1 class D sortase [Bacillus methanolicus]